MPEKNNLPDLLKKVRKIVLGDVSDDLNTIYKSVNKLRKTIDVKHGTFLELIKTVTSVDDKNIEVEKLLQDLGVNFQTDTENNRLSRYKEYESIVSKIPYMKRGIKVLTQNILVPEDYTGDIINIDIEDDKHRNLIESYIKKEKLDSRIFEIVSNTLLYGDYFVEIVIADRILKQSKLLTEGIVQNNYFKIGNTTIHLEQIHYNKLIESKSSKSPNDIVTFLNFIPPHKVIKLGTNENELGYLVLQNVSLTDLKYSFSSSSQIPKNIDNLVNTIFNRIRYSNKQIKDEILSKQELKEILTRLLLSSNIDSLKIRYVPPELMQHFKLRSNAVNEFEPYGTSILYGTEYLAKIIIAIQGSIMVQRLTRSTDKQIINVDIGSSRDVREYIENVRQVLQKRRFTPDGVKVDEIPSLISSFEYIYTPVKDGKRYVEFDQWSMPGDIASRVDDLKALRDALVSAIEIPPAYLGIEENIESKATLSEQNIVFATTVLSYQKEFSEMLESLLQKYLLVKNVPKDVLSTIQVSFQEPLSLLLERKANYFDNLSRLVEAGKTLGIPKEYFIKKYFRIDEEELKELKVEENLNKLLQKKSESEEEGGFGFGGGGEGEEFGI